MATTRLDKLNLDITIGGSQARNELVELRKRASDIRSEMQGLKKDTEQYKDAAKRLSNLNGAMDVLKDKIGLTALSLKELRQEQKKLTALRDSAVPFTAEYDQYQKTLTKVKDRIFEVQNGVQGLAATLLKVVPNIRALSTLTAAAFGANIIGSWAKQGISGLVKMSDQLSDISRISELSGFEVEELNNKLNKINSPTSYEGLRQIAIIAGRLGVGKKDIADFTAAVDQLQVSLGSELGDADQITTTLGKILNVFDGKITAKNITTLGNSMVHMANAGVASAGYIADFTQRLSAMKDAAHLSLPDVIGLGAGMEESGQRVESSSTAIVNLLGVMSKNTAKFAQAAGIDVKQFAEEVRTSPLEALLNFSQAVQKNNNDLSSLIPLLKDLNINGSRVTTTISLLGSKTDFFREKMKEAGDSIGSTGEIQESFEIKSRSLGNEISSLGKNISSIWQDSRLASWLATGIRGINSFVNALKDLPGFLNENKMGISLLVIGLILMNKTLVESSIAFLKQKASILSSTIAAKANAIQQAYNNAILEISIVKNALLEGRITAVTAATKLWSIATKSLTSILGAVIAIAGAALIIFGNYNKELDNSIAKQQALADVQNAVNDQTLKQKQHIYDLANAVREENLTQAERKRRLQALIDISPEYLSGLTEQNITTAKGIGIINNYVLALDRMARAKALTDLRSKLDSQWMEDQATAKVKKTEAQGQGGISKFFLTPLHMGAQYDYQQSVKKSYETGLKWGEINKQVDSSIADLNGQIQMQTKYLHTLKKGTDEYRQAQLQLRNLNDTKNVYLGINDTSSLLTPSGDGYTPTEKAAKKHNGLTAAQKAAKKEASEYQKLKEDIENMRLELDQKMKSADDSEYTRINIKYEKLLARAKKYAKETLQIYGMRDQELTLLLQKETKSQEEKGFSSLNQQRADDAYKDYEKQIRQEEESAQKKRTIQANEYALGKISRAEYDREIEEIDKKSIDKKQEIAIQNSIFSQKALNDEVKMTEDAAKKKETIDQKSLEKKGDNLVKSIEESNRAELLAARQNVRNAIKGSSDPQSSDKVYQARKNLLSIQEKQANDKNKEAFKSGEKTYQQYTDDLLEIQMDFKDQSDQLDADLWEGKINRVMQYVDIAKNAFSSLSTILNNRDQADLNKQKKIDDQKKSSLKKQLDSKLISQSKYDAAISKIEDDADKREKKAARESAKRQKALDLFGATADLAASILVTYKKMGGFPAALPAVAAMGIAGALQIAAIATQPLPELGDGGRINNGPKHKDPEKGLMVVNPKTGKTEMLLERDEAVLSAKTLSDNTNYTMNGTPSQIASALNGLHGGNTWDSGAKIVDMGAWNTPAPQINSESPRVMANGGAISGSNNSSAVLDLSELTTELKALRADVNSWQTNLKSHVVLKDIQDAETKFNNAKKAGNW